MANVKWISILAKSLNFAAIYLNFISLLFVCCVAHQCMLCQQSNTGTLHCNDCFVERLWSNELLTFCCLVTPWLVASEIVQEEGKDSLPPYILRALCDVESSARSGIIYSNPLPLYWTSLKIGKKYCTLEFLFCSIQHYQESKNNAHLMFWYWFEGWSVHMMMPGLGLENYEQKFHFSFL